MNRRIYLFFSVLALLLLMACSSDPVTPTPNPTPSPVIPPTPNGNTISGTVTGPGDVSNTLVIAAVGETPASQAFADASGNYTLADLAPGSYQIIAVKDIDNNGLTNGDYIGAYPSFEAPTPVTPPASGINITMQVYNDGSAPPEPVDPVDPTPTPGTGISGTVTALPGTDIAGTLVGACPVVGDSPDCTNPASIIEIAQAGPSAPYTLDVSAGLYAVAAYQSADGGSTYTVVGIYENSQNLVYVSPPASDINFQIEIAAGATSLDVSGVDKLNSSKLNLDKLQDLLE